MVTVRNLDCVSPGHLWLRRDDQGTFSADYMYQYRGWFVGSD